MSTPLIQITNATSDHSNVYLAFYQKPFAGSTWPIVVWRAITAAPGVPAPQSIPTNYAVAANYILNGVGHQTPPLAINNFTGSYKVSKSGNKIIMAVATTPVLPNTVMVDVDGSTAQSVTISVTLGGPAVYPPQVVQPNVFLSVAMNPQLYVAFITIGTKAGAVLQHAQVASSEMMVNPGQTIYITGSVKAGYKMAIK